MNKYQKALNWLVAQELKQSYCRGNYRLAKKTVKSVLSKYEVIKAYEYKVTLSDIYEPYDY